MCRYDYLTSGHVAVKSTRRQPILPLNLLDGRVYCRWIFLTAGYTAVESVSLGVRLLPSARPNLGPNLKLPSWTSHMTFYLVAHPNLGYFPRVFLSISPRIGKPIKPMLKGSEMEKGCYRPSPPYRNFVPKIESRL